MSETSSFGGVAGQVVRHFVRLGTLLSTIPTLIATVGLALGTGWLATTVRPPATLAWLVAVIVLAPVAGRFGLAAREGDIPCGFLAAGLGRGVFGFALRYGLLAMIWGLPLALSADSVSALFEDARWRWLLLERRGDLPAFFATLIGGMTLFYALALPLLLLLDGLRFGTSLKAGALFAPLVPSLPAAGAPILVGRLAGSVVATTGASTAETAEPELIARRVATAAAPAGVGARAAVGGDSNATSRRRSFVRPKGGRVQIGDATQSWGVGA